MTARVEGRFDDPRGPQMGPEPAMSERFRQADALFDAALDLPTGERAEFVDRACAGDPELHAVINRLLRAHERASEFLAAPAADLAAPLLSDPAVAHEDRPLPPPERVGPFRIVRVLGRGGMGTVYLAERDDAQFSQRVALKLVRADPGSDYLVQRFLEERRILATLEHSHIARLLDGEITPEGVPWFAMEYVEGLPIDRFSDERRLGVDERLKLFLHVCDAVQYAHRNLVVHRDLKPGNILVTADGQVKLLDFGIAKLLDPAGAAPAGVTAVGARMLTPAYASPEQIRGETITTASDVYSLGVLLYELLTGRHPAWAPGRTTREVERRILEHEPERPSTVATRPAPGNAPDGFAPPGKGDPTLMAAARGSSPEQLRRRLRGDLDTIVL
ncbi:MAG: serine/threonine-protein kinase, partial [Gemmatimonadaceae bacterium]